MATDYKRSVDVPNLWPTIQSEATQAVERSPLLGEFYRSRIINHPDFASSLSYILADKLADQTQTVEDWSDFILTIIRNNPSIEESALADLLCQLESNASIKDHYAPLLYFGGYQALQCYRIANHCWHNDLRDMANYIQGQVVSLFGVDIHPAAKLGHGLFIDHAVGIVVGETAVIENDVTLFQSVTLGGTGKGSGDRHPKVRKGAFIGSGALIYGNIEIGENAKIGGGAIVVKPVKANTTVVGQTAKQIGNKE